jgi:hypothetical protein
LNYRNVHKTGFALHSGAKLPDPSELMIATSLNFSTEFLSLHFLPREEMDMTLESQFFLKTMV